MRASSSLLSRFVRAGTLAGLLALTFPTPASVIHAQSAPPPLTPFRGLIDHVSAAAWGGVPNGSTDIALDGHVISGDGRFVVMSSNASDIADHDNNGMDDVFLRDRMTGTT